MRLEDLLARFRAYAPETDIDLLRRAYVFSAFEHRGQVRHSGEPYLIHSLGVASLLVDLKLDVAAVTAGVLHDVVEDTLTTIERVQELFGQEVAHLVEGVTQIGAIPFSSSEERQAENFRKMLLAMVDDVRVILVKLADRLDNMRTLHHLPEARREGIARETLEIYAPIAGRLGIGTIKNELENLAFQSLEPRAYEALRSRVDERRRHIGQLMDTLKETISVRLISGNVQVVQIDGRIKDLYSIHQKVRRQRVDLEHIYDLVAFRVVTQTVRDCYAALGIIHQIWSPVPGAIKDFIAMPRPNGYQSLHTSVVTEFGFPLEVQIRTEEMHGLAEYGVAAHWTYKERRREPQEEDRYFLWMRHLLEWQQEVRDPQEFIQNLKVELYPDEVYTFTPKGLVKALPRGATPIDFAYSVHSDLGRECTGARVNGKDVPLRTRLRNGDIVEILTTTGHEPERDWLNFVVTSHARSKIKHWLHLHEKTRAIDLGRRMIEMEAVHRSSAGRPPSGELLIEIARRRGFATVDVLLAAVGVGRVPVRQLLAECESIEVATTEPGRPAAPAAGSVAEPSNQSLGTMVVLCQDSSLDTPSIDFARRSVFRARCCEPTAADQIVGYITRDGAIAVHRMTCRLAQNLRPLVSLEWVRPSDDQRNGTAT